MTLATPEKTPSSTWLDTLDRLGSTAADVIGSLNKPKPIQTTTTPTTKNALPTWLLPALAIGAVIIAAILFLRK